MKEHYFDIPLEEEIKQTEQHLKQLKSKSSEAVFHCPVCNQDFREVGNYRELKMCGRCYVKTEAEKLCAQVKDIVGATVESFEVVPPSPYGAIGSRGAVGIKQLTLKLPNGKVVKLLREDAPCLIL